MPISADKATACAAVVSCQLPSPDTGTPAASIMCAEVVNAAAADLQCAFVCACEDGSLTLLRELLALGGGRRLDVGRDTEYAFRMA